MVNFHALFLKQRAAPSVIKGTPLHNSSTHTSSMAEGVYQSQTKVDWTAFQQFKLWRKEVERIINGPLEGKSDEVKMNHIYIWAGAHAEQLIKARTSEDEILEIKDPKALLVWQTV